MEGQIRPAGLVSAICALGCRQRCTLSACVFKSSPWDLNSQSLLETTDSAQATACRDGEAETQRGTEMGPRSYSTPSTAVCCDSWSEDLSASPHQGVIRGQTEVLRLGGVPILGVSNLHSARAL